VKTTGNFVTNFTFYVSVPRKRWHNDLPDGHLPNCTTCLASAVRLRFSGFASAVPDGCQPRASSCV